MHITHLQQVSRSVMLAIPPALFDVLHLTAVTKASMTMDDGRLVVGSKAKPCFTLDILLAEAEAAGAYERFK